MECIERLSTVSGSSVPRLNIEFVCHAPLGGINSGDTRTPSHQGLLGVPSAPCFLPSWCNSLSCYNELCSSVQVERPSFSIDILRRPTADSKMEGLPAKGKSVDMKFSLRVSCMWFRPPDPASVTTLPSGSQDKDSCEIVDIVICIPGSKNGALIRC